MSSHEHSPISEKFVISNDLTGPKAEEIVINDPADAEPEKIVPNNDLAPKSDDLTLKSEASATSRQATPESEKEVIPDGDDTANHAAAPGGESGSAATGTSTTARKEISSDTIWSQAELEPITEASSVASDEDEPDTHADTVVVKFVSYHIDSDLEVKVRGPEGVIVYKVYSALIAAASPVWRKMIYGGDHTRPQTGKWIIEMLDSDDDAYGLDVLFSVIHYKFHDIPHRPDVHQLYSIALVVEKYECVHLLVPYMSEWVEGLDQHVVSGGEFRGDYEETLFLCWVIGEGRWFSHVISTAANNSTIDSEGNMINGKGQPWAAQRLPSAIIDLVREHRQKMLTTLVDAIRIAYEQLMDGNLQTLPYCRSAKGGEAVKMQCIMQQFGSLARELKRTGMIPFVDPAEYTGSVAELAAKVQDITVMHFKLPGALPHTDSHALCGINHHDAASNAILARTELSGHVVRQLKVRSHKSGAFTEDLFQGLNDVEKNDPGLGEMEDLRLDRTHYQQRGSESISWAEFTNGGDVIVKVEEDVKSEVDVKLEISD
ncbi:hypothetical protein B0T24DRAFT_525851 [Lasiosphaeria ovina]|uniref:BTB domain-containing protein n=1 Tax=Lasiosphaeria ovina TaxID=92902 RepID=A0AAE0KFL0_9PEZI|nr:hypothetical protein B0T24DRAFT_525851 [Lasiosphaeria ovina]